MLRLQKNNHLLEMLRLQKNNHLLEMLRLQKNNHLLEMLRLQKNTQLKMYPQSSRSLTNNHYWQKTSEIRRLKNLLTTQNWHFQIVPNRAFRTTQTQDNQKTAKNDL